MLQIKSFVFNPYQENTYILYNEQKQCILVDPGMHTYNDRKQLSDFIREQQLEPIFLFNTHGHIDHVLGNRYISDEYGLIPQFHELELPIIIAVQNYAPQMGIHYETSLIPETFLSPEDKIQLGDISFDLIFAPGHSPGHLCLYNQQHKVLIGGDVLFRGSIGRTDLPGGNHQQLLDSIASNIYSLPDDTTVYPGHGPSTTIAEEKRSNPFIKG